MKIEALAFGPGITKSESGPRGGRALSRLRLAARPPALSGTGLRLRLPVGARTGSRGGAGIAANNLWAFDHICLYNLDAAGGAARPAVVRETGMSRSSIVDRECHPSRKPAKTAAGKPPGSGSRTRSHPKRPHTLDYVERILDRFSGNPWRPPLRRRSRDRLRSAWAGIDGQPVMLIGEQKGRDTKAESCTGISACRNPKAIAKLCGRCNWRPSSAGRSLLLLDTPGAYPGIDAEERGQAEAIARNLREMARLPVPVISVCIGEGGSGGAFALGVANHVFMLENAFYSVISPESCAAIICRDSAQSRAGRRRAEDDRARSGEARPDRWHDPRTGGRRA